MNKKPHITIVADNPNSWIHPYVKKLVTKLKKNGNTVTTTMSAKKIKKGGVAVFLSCEEIVTKKILERSQHNLVVHESKLPKGRGMSPMTWQVEEGKNKVPITLFEAVEALDAGDIYAQDYMVYEGHELVDDLRAVQGEMTVKLVYDFIRKYPNVKGRKQVGKPTYYPRRTPKDSELDINRSIKEQFNKLRVVDNERYPATFKHKGHTYILKIYEKE